MHAGLAEGLERRRIAIGHGPEMARSRDLDAHLAPIRRHRISRTIHHSDRHIGQIPTVGGQRHPVDRQLQGPRLTGRTHAPFGRLPPLGIAGHDTHLALELGQVQCSRICCVGDSRFQTLR